MQQDPSKPHDRLPQVAALEYFTDREHAIEAFRRYVSPTDASALRVLVFYGVGGIGKTALIQRLMAELRDRETEPPVPHALFSMENIGDQTRAYREVLIRWRSDLENQFGVSFPRFDLCLGVMLAREGGEPPPLVRFNDRLSTALEFGVTLIQAPVRAVPAVGEMVHLSLHGVAELIKRIVEQTPQLEDLVRRAGGTGDVVQLRERALRDDPTLPEELIRRFAQDLKENLPSRKGKGCRGVLFLDTYEMLWSGREAAVSAQALLLDEWVRTLARYSLGSDVLLVIAGRDRLTWGDAAPEWPASLDQHLLGGLSFPDAQRFLARCGVGAAPVTPASPLQEAIIRCCNESRDAADVSAHPLYLALCAEIVLNTRSAKRIDPKPGDFIAIPTQRVARELATRFLRSLHDSALEAWIKELSLTPRFDDQAALALDSARAHHNGRSAWQQLVHFSFVALQPDGSYRLHKTMREALRPLTGEPDARAVHQWFLNYWTQHSERALAWYHRWTLSPEEALKEWQDRHDSALKALEIIEARQLLTWWSEIALDESDRARIGDEIWGRTHLKLATALWSTPIAPRAASLTAAIAHSLAALHVFNETTFPHDWAMTQNTLGRAFGTLPTGDRGENLRQSIACFEAALRVLTEAASPREWAVAQNNLGNAYWYLPTGDLGENLRRAIACYEATLRVRTEAAFPKDWATAQHNLGTAYRELPIGDRGKNLRQAIACFEAALRVWTEAAFPRLWATAQRSMGSAYRSLPTGDRGENLHRAIACYQAALRVETEADFPQEWASAQVGLGVAYEELPTGDRADNVRQAIAHYEAALRVWTEADFPRDWAITQHDLGNAYRESPTGDRRENLHQAIACYVAALRVQTEAGSPREWAETQRAMGLAYQKLAAVTGDVGCSHKAEACLAAARRVKELPMGHS